MKGKFSVCKFCGREVHPADIVFDPFNDKYGCCFCKDKKQVVVYPEEIKRPEPKPQIERPKNRTCSYCKFDYYYNKNKEYPKTCPNCNKSHSKF